MRISFIVLSILFVAVVLIGVTLYFTNEKPAKEQQTALTVPLSIQAINSSEQNIAVNYSIIVEGNVWRSGTTLIEAPVLQQGPYNHSYAVWGIDDNRTYYSVVVEKQRLLSTEIQRIDLRPMSIGTINASYNGKLGQDQRLDISVYAHGEVRNVLVCLSWGSRIVSLSADNATQIEPPARYKNKVDKCYVLGTIKDEFRHLFISYTTFGALEARDFISVFVIDGDRTPTSQGPVYEDKGRDLWMADINFTISTAKG